ncbi:hypothetical protein HDZ31DRAFT_76516 [Schizophyllum fasciatum]
MGKLTRTKDNVTFSGLSLADDRAIQGPAPSPAITSTHNAAGRHQRCYAFCLARKSRPNESMIGNTWMLHSVAPKSSRKTNVEDVLEGVYLLETYIAKFTTHTLDKINQYGSDIGHARKSVTELGAAIRGLQDEMHSLRVLFEERELAYRRRAEALDIKFLTRLRADCAALVECLTTYAIVTSKRQKDFHSPSVTLKQFLRECDIEASITSSDSTTASTSQEDGSISPSAISLSRRPRFAGYAENEHESNELECQSIGADDTSVTAESEGSVVKERTANVDMAGATQALEVSTKSPSAIPRRTDGSKSDEAFKVAHTTTRATSEEASQARLQAQRAEGVSKSAKLAAQAAEQEAKRATTTADEASKLATSASSQATGAKQKAIAASDLAKTATTQARSAKTEAEAAFDYSARAISKTQQAKSLTGTADKEATAAVKRASEAVATVEHARKDADAIVNSVTDIIDSILESAEKVKADVMNAKADMTVVQECAQRAAEDSKAAKEEAESAAGAAVHAVSEGQRAMDLAKTTTATVQDVRKSAQEVVARTKAQALEAELSADAAQIHADEAASAAKRAQQDAESASAQWLDVEKETRRARELASTVVNDLGRAEQRAQGLVASTMAQYEIAGHTADEVRTRAGDAVSAAMLARETVDAASTEAAEAVDDSRHAKDLAIGAVEDARRARELASTVVNDLGRAEQRAQGLVASTMAQYEIAGHTADEAKDLASSANLSAASAVANASAAERTVSELVERTAASLLAAEQRADSFQTHVRDLTLSANLTLQNLEQMRLASRDTAVPAIEPAPQAADELDSSPSIQGTPDHSQPSGTCSSPDGMVSVHGQATPIIAEAKGEIASILEDARRTRHLVASTLCDVRDAEKRAQNLSACIAGQLEAAEAESTTVRTHASNAALHARREAASVAGEVSIVTEDVQRAKEMAASAKDVARIAEQRTQELVASLNTQISEMELDLDAARACATDSTSTAKLVLAEARRAHSIATSAKEEAQEDVRNLADTISSLKRELADTLCEAQQVEHLVKNVQDQLRANQWLAPGQYVGHQPAALAEDATETSQGTAVTAYNFPSLRATTIMFLVCSSALLTWGAASMLPEIAFLPLFFTARARLFFGSLHMFLAMYSHPFISSATLQSTQ